MSTGFTFGAAKTTAPPAFGSTSLTFGAAAGAAPQATQPPQFGFGAAATPAPFGAAAATPATFGASTPAPFGAAATPAQNTGFQFGAAAPATSVPSLFGSTPSSGLNFKPATTAPSGGLFGTAPAAGGLTFGSTPSTTTTGGLPTFGAATTGLSFGTATTPSTGLNFSTPTASVAPSTGLTFGTGTSFGAPSTNLSFGAAPSGGLSFGATTIAQPSFGGLGGFSTTTTTLTLPTATSSAPVGLGGIASSNTKSGTSATPTQKETPPKEQALPNEILQTVEQFKEHIKQQKAYSSDITRCSVRNFRKVEQEIDLLNKTLGELEGQLQKNRQMAEHLKYDTAVCFQNVEMAQRTHDTQPGLQYENVAPLRFFMDLVDRYEHELHSLKVQIDGADRYVKSHKSPDALEPQDLSLGMRRLHETFVALAGRLQSVHSQVEAAKQTYLNVRKHVLNDSSNPFDQLPDQWNAALTADLRKAAIYSPPKVASGPTPFGSLANGNVVAQQSQAAQAGGFGTNTSQDFRQTGTGNSSFLGGLSFGQNNTTGGFGLQLQNPPPGSKRKH